MDDQDNNNTNTSTNSDETQVLRLREVVAADMGCP